MKGLNVLLVDDNEDDRLLLKRSLKQVGLSEFQEARDGREALGLAEQAPPNLIFMDTNMPYLEGPDACRKIRETPQGKNVVVIGMSDTDREDMWQEAGADGFYAKRDYSDIDLLKRTIEDALRKRGYSIPTAAM